MKLSAWHKDQGDDVKLITDWRELRLWKYKNFDKIYISKVFTDSFVPLDVMSYPNVVYGGTGYFYDKAPPLSDEIEHHMPDYHLYDDWIEERVAGGKKRSFFKSYTDYSIGFLTKGCFRHCPFCVNRNTDRAEIHSPLEEFYDPSRSKICLLDDNFLSHPKWASMLAQLQDTGKRFRFDQGLDVRILTEEKARMLFDSKYDGSYVFAFDNVADYNAIEEKLKLIRKVSDVRPMFYVLVAFDRNGVYDEQFWHEDLIGAFKRIELLIRYGAYPYIMRFKRYETSPFKGMYVTLARWANQHGIFSKKSFLEYVEQDKETTQRYLREFLDRTDGFKDCPQYLTMKASDYV